MNKDRDFFAPGVSCRGLTAADVTPPAAADLAAAAAAVELASTDAQMGRTVEDLLFVLSAHFGVDFSAMLPAPSRDRLAARESARSVLRSNVK